MKTSLCILVGITCALMPVGASGGQRSSANYSVAADTVDSGGKKSSSVNYSNDGSLGGVGGISTAPGPETVKHSYIGQLYDMTGINLNATPTTVNEGSTRQLSASALVDDGTTFALAGPSVAWIIVSGPIFSINASGLATAGTVYENTPATVRGDYSGMSGTLGLTVVNVGNDDFGIYAGDGVDDLWQVQNFGLNNPSGLGNADPDGDRQNNSFEYVAGTNPSDANSKFNLSIANVPGQPTRKALTFSPRFATRTYTVQYKLTLGPPGFASLPGSSTSDAGPVRTVTDLNATDPTRFYRVQITYP